MDAIKMDLETIRSLAYELSENMSVIPTQAYISTVGERIINLVNQVEASLAAK